MRLFKLAKTPGGGTGAPLRQHDQLAQQMGRYRADEEAGIGPEGGIDLSLASLAWDTETQDDGIDYNHYAYRARPISTGPPPRTGSNNERIEMTENPISATGPSSTGAAPPPPLPYPAPVPGSFSYAQVQHLQRMREKYGDNRELYEPMEWKPPVPPSDADPSPPRQNQLQLQQNRNNNYYNNNNHTNTRVDF